jgi:hypothetical protein
MMARVTCAGVSGSSCELARHTARILSGIARPDPLRPDIVGIDDAPPARQRRGLCNEIIDSQAGQSSPRSVPPREA